MFGYLGLCTAALSSATDDVKLGNNRGNKYSKKSTHLAPTSIAFWNFSMDQFAFHDIPDSIGYILATTSQPSLSYVGFSQGTAQAFATLSIHPTLNDKVDVFIALAPAMSPAGLHNGVVDALIKTSPEVIFLAFGRRSILSSATMWQAILYPPIFVRIIDMSLSFLFNWSCKNISSYQKLAAYPHLYSFTSTKSVVHWFQIIRNKSFQMYDDDVQAPLSLGATNRYYKVAKFPTRNIKTPIVLVYGGSDSLVDIKVMLRELPRHTVAIEVPHFEHLDFLWAQDVDTLVFPHVFEALETYAGRDHLQERPFLYRSIKNGPLSLTQSPKYSEGKYLSLTMGGTSDGDTEMNGTSTTKYVAALRERSDKRMEDTPSPRTIVNQIESSPETSTSEYIGGSMDTPTPMGSKLGDVTSRSSAKNKRRGSFAGVRSIDSNTTRTKRFSEGGIRVGAGKATVGGVNSPAQSGSESNK